MIIIKIDKYLSNKIQKKNIGYSNDKNMITCEIFVVYCYSYNIISIIFISIII
jgi:hypothetical protein